MQNILAIAFLLTGCLSVMAAIPQLLQLLKVKRSDELSLFSWCAWLLYQVIALAYTITKNLPVYEAINVLWSLFYFAMVFLIIKYRVNPRSTSKHI